MHFIKDVIGVLKKYVIRHLLQFERISENMKSPGLGLAGDLAIKLMTEANNRSVQNAVELLGIKRGEHVLEIGAGNGFGVLCMKEKVPGRLVAVEISAKFRSIIKDQNISGLELYDKDAIDMSSFIQSNSVDKLLAMNVVYFLDPFESYAKEMKRILKRETGLGILGCKPKAIMTGHDHVFKNKSVSEIKKTLSEVGLQVKEEFVNLDNPVESYIALYISNHS
jgi:cyclopropane fatty-acyl-phospholipid synthase-like methyltransferase